MNTQIFKSRVSVSNFKSWVSVWEFLTKSCSQSLLNFNQILVLKVTVLTILSLFCYERTWEALLQLKSTETG